MGLFSTLRSLVSPSSMLQEVRAAHMQTYLGFKSREPRRSNHMLLASTRRERVLKRAALSGESKDNVTQQCLEETMGLSLFPLPKAIRALSFLAFEEELGAKHYANMRGAAEEANELAQLMVKTMTAPDFLDRYHSANLEMEATLLQGGRWHYTVKRLPDPEPDELPYQSVVGFHAGYTLNVSTQNLRRVRIDAECEVCGAQATGVSYDQKAPLLECAKCGHFFALAS